MKAVVLKAPYKVVCEERPTPQITADDQVIVKVLASGLCGQFQPLWFGIHELMPRIRFTLVS
jgi:galactitol-1-phosphate 5-dehydrogenase